MSILDELAAYARIRVEKAKEIKSSNEICQEAFKIDKGNNAFEKAVKSKELSFICECKKASPSKGIIADDFHYLDIALDYERAGADAISVLTEPKWFLGRDEYLEKISKAVKLPLLRKDFTVDEYMLYEAKIMGASAVLLIVAILQPAEIKRYLAISEELGLSALVECHDEKEVDTALESGARIVGVNNRNLKDFSVDITLGEKLRKQIPESVAFVSESGIRNAEDVRRLRSIGADAVLIGETLMKAENRVEMLNTLRGKS
ncbi:MAG: indole-3-glycerol phosphate synthase TrpC [Lachnospiraceae bacterium]|nr:indole-3-glycerol phosphate synthase TrpC [Lachnospiraceae bacterium]